MSALAISQVKGQTGRSGAPLRPFFVRREAAVLKDDPAPRRPPRRRRAHGRFRRLGHAGPLRLADRGAPRGARAMPACSTSRTCAPSTSNGAGARDFLRYALANNVDKLTVPGKALYSCLLRPDGGVLDDLIVYFLREDFFRHRRQRGDRGQGHRVVRASLLAERAPASALCAARRSRDDRRAGAARARQGLAGAARQRSRERRRSRRSMSREPHGRRCSSRAPATPARTDSRSSLPAARAAALWPRLRGGRRARPAGWARATRCGSRPG